MIVLIDTSVLLSAALRNRLPERVVLHVASSDDCSWAVTPEIHREYIEVLRRPKFHFSDEILQQWNELIESRCIRIASPPAPPDLLRDPKDAPFLAAAIAIPAHYLITGDQDLLVLAGMIDTRIVTVAEFTSQLGIQ